LQVVAVVVHMKQTRMAVQAVVHLARQVQMVLTLAVEAEHKLPEEQPVILQVHLLDRLCKVVALVPAEMVVAAVVAVAGIGVAVVELVQTLLVQLAAVGRDT
jgi:hypothetical protein